MFSLDERGQNVFKQLTIPAAPSSQQAPIIALVDEILAMKKVNPQEDISAKEADIKVCELYGLSEEERKIVGVV